MILRFEKCWVSNSFPARSSIWETLTKDFLVVLVEEGGCYIWECGRLPGLVGPPQGFEGDGRVERSNMASR